MYVLLKNSFKIPRTRRIPEVLYGSITVVQKRWDSCLLWTLTILQFTLVWISDPRIFAWSPLSLRRRCSMIDDIKSSREMIGKDKKVKSMMEYSFRLRLRVTELLIYFDGCSSCTMQQPLDRGTPVWSGSLNFRKHSRWEIKIDFTWWQRSLRMFSLVSFASCKLAHHVVTSWISAEPLGFLRARKPIPTERCEFGASLRRDREIGCIQNASEIKAAVTMINAYSSRRSVNIRCG